MVITATFGHVGLLGLTGLGTGVWVSATSDDMELSGAELSDFAEDFKSKSILFQALVQS